MHEAIRRFGPKAELYVRPMFWATKGGAGPISVDGESTQFLLCVYLRAQEHVQRVECGEVVLHCRLCDRDERDA